MYWAHEFGARTQGVGKRGWGGWRLTSLINHWNKIYFSDLGGAFWRWRPREGEAMHVKMNLHIMRAAGRRLGGFEHMPVIRRCYCAVCQFAVFYGNFMRLAFKWYHICVKYYAGMPLLLDRTWIFCFFVFFNNWPFPWCLTRWRRLGVC